MTSIRAINSNPKAINFTSSTNNDKKDVNLNANNSSADLKPNTVTIAGKTINKKTAILGGIGILAAVTGIAIACAYIIKGNDAKSAVKATDAMLQEANELTKPANAMSDEAQNLRETINKTIGEVKALFNEGASEKVEIAPLDNGVQIMKYTTQDGIQREGTFVENLLTNLQETLKDGKKNIIKFDESGWLYYEGGVETLKNGDKKIAQLLEGDIFAKDYEILENGTKRTAKKVVKGDFLRQYIEGFECTVDSASKDLSLYEIFLNDRLDSYKFEKKLSLCQDKPTSLIKKQIGKMINNRHVESYAQCLSIDCRTNKPTSYIKDYKSADDIETIGKELKFEDGKPTDYKKGHKIKYDKNGKSISEDAEKEFEFKDGKWKKVNKKVDTQA